MTRWKEYEVTSGPLQHLSKIQEFQEMGKTGVVRGGTTPRTRFVEAMSKILSREKKGFKAFRGEREIGVRLGAD